MAVAGLLAGYDMEHASVEIILGQLKKAIGVTKDKELAAFLGVTGKAISAAKRRGSVPSKWILKVDGQCLSELAICSKNPQRIETNLPMGSESRIDLLEAERRRLSEEIRQLHAKKDKLMEENAILRERLARYEERAIKPDVEDADPQPRPLA